MTFSYAFVAALAGATPAAVQQDSPVNGPAIVVQGTRDPKRRAQDYIDKVMPPVFDGQISRFEEPICPAVVGLPDALKTQVVGRIWQVANAASIPLSAAKCTPNFLIIVVDDKKALIEGMRQKKQSYLYGIGDDRTKQLESAAGPVSAWQITDVIGADGMPLRFDGDGYPRLFTTAPPSRVVESTRKRILGGVMVIEQRALINVTTRQLADFAMMRLLMPIETNDRPAPDLSVLRLFQEGVRPEQAPQSLTWWDLAFLKALFATPSNQIADVQRHEIREKMLDEISRVPKE